MKTFKKSDLRTGMLVENRYGDKGMVLLNTAHGDVISGDGKSARAWFHLSKLDSDLKYPGMLDGDIIRVYDNAEHFEIRDRISFDKKTQLIWEREEENTIVTIDGVEYSESTLRSLIKKATNS